MPGLLRTQGAIGLEARAFYMKRPGAVFEHQLIGFARFREVGTGKNELFSGQSWKRLKMDGLLSFGMQKIPRRARRRLSGFQASSASKRSSVASSNRPVMGSPSAS